MRVSITSMYMCVYESVQLPTRMLDLLIYILVCMDGVSSKLKLPCVAACRSTLQCVFALFFCYTQVDGVSSKLPCVAACCSMLQCVFSHLFCHTQVDGVSSKWSNRFRPRCEGSARGIASLLEFAASEVFKVSCVENTHCNTTHCTTTHCTKTHCNTVHCNTTYSNATHCNSGTASLLEFAASEVSRVSCVAKCSVLQSVVCCRV